MTASHPNPAEIARLPQIFAPRLRIFPTPSEKDAQCRREEVRKMRNLGAKGRWRAA